MKICIVTPEFPGKTIDWGGIATYQKHLVHEFSRMGHEVHVLTLRAKRTGDFLEDGIHFHERELVLPNWMKWDLIADYFPIRVLFLIWQADRELYDLNKKYSFDLVQATNYGALCAFYVLRKNRPVVVTWLSSLTETMGTFNEVKKDLKLKLAIWLEKLAVRRSDVLVTNTLVNRKSVSDSFLIPEESIRVIPHGIIMINAEHNKKFESGNDKQQVLYVGRLEGRKGTDILLTAIPKVLMQCPDVIFILAGKDFSGGRYQKDFFSSYPEFCERVEFKGAVTQEELGKLYQFCDVFVSPARYESFGLTFLEAMSYGKPVVGCRVGGVPEVVSDGITGILVPPEDSSALAGALVKLLSDGELRLSMGEKALELAREKFSSEKMAESTLTYYHEIIRDVR